ncbi:MULTISPECIES: gamma-glutamyl-gamma-aminobutyrate hydrolase family protein [unclassified Paludibacterium]|uniref:gamma-glutamyl-gamma-aminobutyrate hydrolase family protein n=1 Tax=unclassified Paludibacterium TaxID=2618429 RepID=UPI001C0428F8|nr:gamma-glutamyl-gamma-aminobutyrate hydrolase family protein [Paludibacterium sp. B53371]BEV70999.1 gamma-glutamyl-gamma-aminobutyrate hydrolase family protein [Paludibacterium sp. THUN1379]
MQQAIIGIPCDNKMIGLLPFHAVGDKYIAAAAGGAGGVPILIPAMGDPAHREAILDLVDGVLLPGSPSNIEPHHYNGEPSRPGNPTDPARDATTLPLIPHLIERGIPVLGICRGFQEMNVALGGELFQYVHEQPGFRDHREPEVDDMAVKYAPAHAVHFPQDSLFRQWLSVAEAQVNSLHGQGVRRLGPSLRAEALSDDGLVEAFSVPEARAFAMAVQWHPEWKFADNPVSMAIFKAFGDACRARRAQRSR